MINLPPIFSAGSVRRFGLLSCAATLLAACADPKDGSADGVQRQVPPDLPHYSSSIAGILDERDRLLAEFHRARGTEERRAVIESARKVLVKGIFQDLMPHWYGTPWDFNGITETPGEGEIACGYFVSTILRDAGLEVERFKLAQQASQNIIRSLTDRDHMQSFHGGTFENFVSGMRGLGDGLYIIGLDRHVGFIVQSDGQSFFIHSDGGANRCVVKEPTSGAPVLRRSRYRIVGKISADDRFVGLWLSGEKIATVL